MKRIPFERPTDHYDEKVLPIDEQLCELLKLRKDISNNQPGFPPLEYIDDWAVKYDLYEDLLNSVFGALWNDEQFRPVVEPEGFRKYIQVLKSVEIGEGFYSLPFIRQYENVSVVCLNIDWEMNEGCLEDRIHRHSFWKLFIKGAYDCRIKGGGGSDGHLSYNFIVSPPLPDNLSGFEFSFKEYKNPLRDEESAGQVIRIRIE
ncbi:hypothetical protein M4D55_03180 [Metabacillus idriensis]|uniref:Uncharacterized protein n=1 Tax=Metabacillus idriensis TaxID=324768 RepID=A0A6I2M8F8_9BACI|nr:hypothetical protein [Metabacillus idriensis]MCM3594793.1 hypothetical protein [Metabacillus idriensis]MRX53186.1 hypothetical protein [Metabacillus idriensis]OHR66162.1 hypothetical protein HMPREF3291_12170 [Bacillus sp. HMSC76G11]